MKTLVVIAAVLSMSTNAYASSWVGRWAVKDIGTCSGDVHSDENAIEFTRGHVATIEYDGTISKVSKTRDGFNISVPIPKNDLDGAARIDVWKVSLSKDGQTAKIDGTTYRRCK